MTRRGEIQGGGTSRGRGKIKCFACGLPVAKHRLGPCPYYEAGIATKQGMKMAKESENRRG